jgi:multidrug efflux pump
VNPSGIFLRRPKATALLAIALALAGAIAYRLLPIASLPQIDLPVISVSAQFPGAEPSTMASAVATPLERQFGKISGVTEMTSSSFLGSTQIVLQFDLSRDVNAAERDVQAAINAAAGQLPADLPSQPTFRKVNPSDAPIVAIGLTSKTLSQGQIYDAATTVIQQKLSQLPGVGQVIVGGSSLPATRIELNPMMVSHYGIGFEQIRNVIANSNVNRPKGRLESANGQWTLAADDQIHDLDDYRSMVVSAQGTPVQLGRIAEVRSSVENLLTAGICNGDPAALVVVFRQPGANVVETVDGIRKALPQLKMEVSPQIDFNLAFDQTTTIRASIADVEVTLVVSVLLVTAVVFVFLRDWRATVTAAVAVPLSLLGSFAVMYLLGYSLDNLSLMALTISTGFVIDDAIVVIEDIMRHQERGLSPVQAALEGSREIGFTVMSMTISLVAVFLPILLMGGIVGRIFREFAVTLSVSVVISLIVSLTVTPVMCSLLLKQNSETQEARLSRWSELQFQRLQDGYGRTLQFVLRHPKGTIAVAALTFVASIGLLVVIPKGFFPQEDSGRIMVTFQSATDSSFPAMQRYMQEVVKVLNDDPAVANAVGFTGTGKGVSTSTNLGRLYVSLRPLSERRIGADDLIARLRGKMQKLVGVTVYFQSMQDVKIGGRMSSGIYQYTLQSNDDNLLHHWLPIIQDKVTRLPGLQDVSNDEQDGGLMSHLSIDRETAGRLGVSASVLDETLYDAFGQREVSTIDEPLNQYHVIMEAAPQYWSDPSALRYIYVHGTNGTDVPLSAFTKLTSQSTSLAVNHQSQLSAATISFNLAPGLALSSVTKEIDGIVRHSGMPEQVHAGFQGTAQAFQDSLATEPLLLLMAIVTIYVVLGMLYESYIHPITILSTLPSAGTGALIALMLCGLELSIIALIGILLLIGIVKKNAIMMVDFALQAEREEGLSTSEAIFKASMLRFRPILMTTAAALLGAVPLVLSHSLGSEYRIPLAVSIIGGLLLSQLLTLYTTPVIYVYMERVAPSKRIPVVASNGSGVQPSTEPA